MILLHGTFIDEFLIELALPVSIFGALYWWSSRNEKKKKKLQQQQQEAMKRELPDQPPGP